MFVEVDAHTHTHTHMELLLNGLSSNSAIRFRSSSNKSFLRQSHMSQSPTELWFHVPCSSSSSLVCHSGFRTRRSGRRGGAGKGRGGRVAAVGAAVVAMVDAAEEVPEETTRSQAALLLRPTPAEAARTVMEVCVEGTLSTLSEDGWPLGTEIRFAVDVDGNPVFSLQPSALHTRNLLSDSRCSLHAQVSFSVLWPFLFSSLAPPLEHLFLIAVANFCGGWGGERAAGATRSTKATMHIVGSDCKSGWFQAQGGTLVPKP
jgi:hypothetical protein